jgi:FkbM family methyltransferase
MSSKMDKHTVSLVETTFNFKDYEYKAISIEKGTHPSYNTFVDESIIRDQLWNIQPGDIVVDVGASYGVYTLTALVAGAEYVYAWSPQSHGFLNEKIILDLSLSVNGWQDKCTVYDTGIYDKDGWLDCYIQKFFKEEPKNYTKTPMTNCVSDIIKVNTLDYWYETEILAKNKSFNGKVVWMKIDVEGAEKEVIKGAKRFIRDANPIILNENHLQTEVDNGVKQLLKEFGYKEVVTLPYANRSHTIFSNAVVVKQEVKEKDEELKKMKIGIVSTHSWPIPYKTHSGDLFYANLARALDEMGHEVTFFAPEGSYEPPHGKRLTMPCAWGTGTPTPSECEQECYHTHFEELVKQDIVHDFSITKRVADSLNVGGYMRTISTLMSGTWGYPKSGRNIICQSAAQRERGLRGATDYENTPWPDYAGPTTPPIKEAHVVHDGIDTDFYVPTYEKGNYFLFLGRWAWVRGYALAIEVARQTGIELVMAGEHPDREATEYQKNCALDAIRLAEGLPNVHFEWLPPDPDHHTAKRHLIQGAKALLFPVQFQEPFGLMQPESLACGTPVIATRFGSVPEILVDGVTGYIVENNVPGFTDALSKIDKIKPAICREQAVRRFDYRVMAKNYLKEYEIVLNGGSW